MDIWKNAAISYGHTGEQFPQLFIVSDGQLDVSWDDPILLVVTGSITSELKNLSSEVFKHGSYVDRSTRADTLGVTTLFEITSDSRDRELEASLGGFRDALLLGFATACDALPTL